MKTWQKIVISTLINLWPLACIYLFSVWKHRQDPAPLGRKDVASGRNGRPGRGAHFFPSAFTATSRLQGTTVWMKNGYTIPNFRMSRGRCSSPREGLIPSLQRLEIKKIVKVAVPAKVDDASGTAAVRLLRFSRCPGAMRCSPRPSASSTATRKLLSGPAVFLR